MEIFSGQEIKESARDQCMFINRSYTVCWIWGAGVVRVYPKPNEAFGHNKYLVALQNSKPHIEIRQLAQIIVIAAKLSVKFTTQQDRGVTKAVPLFNKPF
uniref:Uncharacterized protein n=1 Tax=Aureimonas frigidaquae TaxID=424757 RepID=A0A0P0Z2M3_9HYPH|nr:hypothetical protein [Aureimonas frigidaquae]